MPFSAPIAVSARRTFDDGDEVSIPLNRSAVFGLAILDVALTYTIASGAKALHEDGWGALIRKLTVEPSGGRPPLRVDGYGAMLQAELAMGDALAPAPTLPGTSSSTVTGRLQLPIFLNTPDAPDPWLAYYNPRDLADFQLQLDLRELGDVLTGGGALSAISGEARVVQYLRTGIGNPRNPAVPARFVNHSEINITGATEVDIDLRIGGSIRRVLIVARDGPALSDSRSDDVVDTLAVQLNGRTDLAQPQKWRAMQAAGTVAGGVALPTGVALIDTDPFNETNGDVLVPAGGAAVQSLKLKVATLATCKLDVYVETFKV